VKPNGDGFDTIADGRNGIGTRYCNVLSGQCNGANRMALSLGYRYIINPNVAIKTEFRFDSADQEVFQDLKKGTWERINKLVGLSMVAGF
jgi:hypothetical protein